MDDRVQARAASRVTWLLLLAVALVGLSHVGFLPPWEGFDETAHWSYVQELADRGRPPHYGVDGLSRDLDLYPGPMPYGGAPPFDKTGRLTYRTYRQAGAPPIVGGPTRYVSGRELNWQAQHPPLYYLLMVSVYRLAHGVGWIDHLLALRVASYALAFAGFALGVLATARRAAAGATTVGYWAAPIMAAWPFLVPEFFPEFARIGNDSLCLLWVGAAWALLLEALDGEGAWGVAAALGVVLGLGLLTKAFFLPITAGAAVILLARWWFRGCSRALLGQAALTGMLALAIGGWWYVAKRMETGSLIGSDEFIHLKHVGGMAAILDGFSAGEMFRGLLVIPATFMWAGTWSLARLPEILLIIPTTLLVVTGFSYVSRLRRGGLVTWTPLALAIPMAAGLVYHVFTWMAGTSAVTPGWYLHILAAPLGFALALGWSRPRLLAILTSLTGAYTLVAWGFQLSLFSGCASKLGHDKHYVFEGTTCFLSEHTLAALGHPIAAASLLLGGVITACAALVLACIAYRPVIPEGPVALSTV